MFSWVLPALLVLFTQQQWAIAKQTPIQQKKKKKKKTQTPSSKLQTMKKMKEAKEEKTKNEPEMKICEHTKSIVNTNWWVSQRVFFFFFLNQYGESRRVGLFFLPSAFCNIFFYKLKISAFCNLSFVIFSSANQRYGDGISCHFSVRTSLFFFF